MSVLLILWTLAYPDTALLQWVTRGQHFAYVEAFDSAEVYFQRVIKAAPDDPMGYLLMAGLLDLYMLDYSINTREKEFFAYTREVEKKAKPWLKRYVHDTTRLAWAHFYLGAAASYRALYQGRKRRFLSALRDGLRAVHELSTAVKLDSTLYDAYLGLGVYDIAMSELPKFLRWLPGVDGNRKKRGLAKIRKAATHGLISKYAALDALAWALAYDRKPWEGIKIARRLVQEFPSSRTFRWTLGFALFRGGRYTDAYRVYQEILYSTLQDQAEYPYNIAIILYWLARIDYVRGRYTRSLYWIDVARSLLDQEWRSGLKGDLLKDLAKVEKWDRLRLRARRAIQKGSAP